ncbi:MAG: LD-carboxypeptidase [Bacteroidetes bacterium HGW-Bacteroidetes-6]|jgi:muramoyltetrapeptide carboxypeptidase|nr:MAG: LD-carboxypeptidase [Bacteroidetes bacterium HGW-Bacteroidetes-6]
MIPFLKPGDTIALAAPSRKVFPVDYEPFSQFLLQKGYKVKLSSNLGLSHHQFAGNDAERAVALNALFEDSTVKAMVMVRGGYGAARIVDLLNWNILQQKPKWICGFSDITVFLNHAYSKTGLPSIHSDMSVHFSNDEHRPNFDQLMNVLEGQKVIIETKPHPFNRKGKAHGILVGGNLSVFYSLLGSQSFPDMREKILFIEDLDEYLYHIDRMMLAFERAGIFSHLAGVVVGGMSDMRDNEVAFGMNAVEIANNFFKRLDIPVMYNFPAGHITDNRSFFVGAPTRIVVDEAFGLLEQY